MNKWLRRIRGAVGMGLAWAAGWAFGLLLILFPFALVAVGLASRKGSELGTWQIIATISGPFILLSAAAASGSLMLARMAQDRESLEVSAGTKEGAFLANVVSEVRSQSVASSERM